MSSPTWSLRAVVPQDRPFLEGLYGEAFPIKYDEEFYGSLIKNEYRRTPLFTRVCVDDALGPLGSVTCRIKSSPDVESTRGGAHLYVMTMAVSSTARRTRTGTRLMNAVIHHATYDAPRVEALYLHVLTTNDVAIKFYESLGFVRQQRIEDFYTFDDDNHAAFLYVLRLTGKSVVERVPERPPRIRTVLERVWTWIRGVFFVDDDEEDEEGARVEAAGAHV